MYLDGLPISELSVDDRNYLELNFSKTCEHLSLNQCGIKSLSNFPSMHVLSKLELAGNCLVSRRDPLGIIPLMCKQLTTLNLSNNFLNDLESLKPLGKLGDTLTRLDLSANPVADVNGYRESMFELIPSLYVLDGLDRHGNEVLDEQVVAKIDDQDDEYDEEDEESSESCKEDVE